MSKTQDGYFWQRKILTLRASKESWQTYTAFGAGLSLIFRSFSHAKYSRLKCLILKNCCCLPDLQPLSVILQFFLFRLLSFCRKSSKFLWLSNPPNLSKSVFPPVILPQRITIYLSIRLFWKQLRCIFYDISSHHPNLAFLDKYLDIEWNTNLAKKSGTIFC